MLTSLLHVVHPVARLCGRLNVRSCERAQGIRARWPVPGAVARWTERGEAPEVRRRRVEETMQALGSTVRRGGDWDPWDLEVTCGALGGARVIMAVEDHGAGNQLVRIRWWPNLPATAVALTATTAALSLAAAFGGGWSAAAILATASAGTALRAASQCSVAVAVIDRAVCEQESAGPLTGTPLAEGASR